MTSKLEAVLLVSTFERPHHLKRVLLSIALQQEVEGKFEVVVTDDGSRDETPKIVEDFARTAPFPVRFTTHPHDGFQLAKCRNEGVIASTAPYLVFLDGDCVIPPYYLYHHLKQRRRQIAMTGNCVRFERDISERIDETVIRSGEYMKWVPHTELRRLAYERRKAWFYRITRHPRRPKLFAGTAAIWRSDYERVNGYDENFLGWGCEDDDLHRRLCRAGVRVRSILPWTFSYHLWHPSVPSFPKKWREGGNVQYLTRGIRLTRCRNGLQKLAASDLKVRIVGKPARPDLVAQWTQGLPSSTALEPEVEILFLPGSGGFSGRADCNILVVLDDSPVAKRLEKAANAVLTPQKAAQIGGDKWRPLGEFDTILRAVA